MLAQCYITLGDWEKARALLLKDNLFVARNGDRYAMLAAAHARFGDYSAAAAQWKKALFFSPDDATVRRDVAAFLAAHPDTELTRILQEIERGQ
jgi:Flp pilus assembly protein TadD